MIDRRTVLRGSLGALGAASLATLAGCSSRDAESEPAGFDPSVTPDADTGPINPRVVGTIATGLAVPWGVAFDSAGVAYVSERDTGRILRIRGGDTESIGEVPGVALSPGRGEGGLLGLAFLPGDDSTLFVHHTTADDDRVVRIDLSGGGLGNPQPILTGIPRANTHHGGRLLAGPDGSLFVSTGDAQQRSEAQNPDSPLGKILRIDADGAPAAGNPSGSAVWSLGHRNVEGLALDADGRLWASEFGQDSVDELNLIEAGGNYAWPGTEGTGSPAGQRDPLVTWPTSECSPAGLAITQSTAFVAALRGRSLWGVPLDGPRAGRPVRYFAQEFGRLRTVVVAPDGDLWVTTSNTDGRGDPRDGDDRILRVSLT